MTSVYGVTYVGAREQIKRRLEEKGLIDDDRLLFSASCYAANVSSIPRPNPHLHFRFSMLKFYSQAPIIVVSSEFDISLT